jgi:hypothetical protein
MDHDFELDSRKLVSAWTTLGRPDGIPLAIERPAARVRIVRLVGPALGSMPLCGAKALNISECLRASGPSFGAVICSASRIRRP